VRNRGFFSRNPNKLGLEIDFDRYATGQRFQGLRQLVLDNMYQDEILMREPLAILMFHRVGMPASRQSYARFSMNGEFQGFYSLLEPIDELFLKRVYHDESAYLLEFRQQPGFPFTASYPGDDLAIWKTLFAPRAHALEPDEQLWGPIRDLFKTVNFASISSTSCATSAWRSSSARGTGLPASWA
jgi:spore coat protein CotH